MELIPIRRALLSVTDKTGLADLARALVAHRVELLSTGGSAALLREAGIPVTDVAQVTGLPEMLDGRVKTLHPAIHGGLLADRDRENHRADLDRHRIKPIDLLIVNLYAFEATAARAGVTEGAVIEAIDIGGPAMIRAASKNHRHVVVVTDPAQYGEIVDALAANGGAIPRNLARRFAGEAFRRTASYDAAIAAWFAAGASTSTGASDDPVIRIEKVSDLRYGENPHQPAALFRDLGGDPGITAALILQGKEMSYTNWLDLDRGVRLLFEFAEPAAVVIKHATPCGVGFGTTIGDAFTRAWHADPLSGFGGIVVLNRPADAGVAGAAVEHFLEVIAAPSFTDEARSILARKKNLRLLATGPLTPPRAEWLDRSILGGRLRQAADPAGGPDEFRVVSRRAPTDSERDALVKAWRIAKHVRSNAIVLADTTGSVGLGGGQTSRIDAVDDAIRKGGRGVGLSADTVLASDAFFPFRDSIDAAHDAGIRAVIQPGGSLRDDESIAAADEHEMALVFTGRRAFLH